HRSPSAAPSTLSLHDALPIWASNVVSVLGTAMTEQHVGVLRRFADRIVLLFDADSAGDAAVDRVVQLFLTQPVEIGVATMPAGLDRKSTRLNSSHGSISYAVF